MIQFDDDSEIMEFPEQVRDTHVSWCEVQIRGPKTESQPYHMKNHSIYLTMWEGERTGLCLTAKQARKIATWLITAADIIDERNNNEKETA